MPKLAQPTFKPDLGQVLRDWDARRTRSKQRKFGPSSLGECRRRAAYQIIRQPWDTWGDKAKAIQGTLLHRGALAALKTAHGGYTEVKLETEDVQGSCDWLRQDPLDLWVVDDLKTLGKDVYELKIREDASTPNLYQAHKYASMLRAGAFSVKEKRLPHEPIDITDIEIIYLCRDDGRTHTRQMPYRQSIADEADAWLQEVKDLLATDGIAHVPRDKPGPDSVICKNCPFRRACWGLGDREDDSSTNYVLELGPEELVEHVVGYDHYRRIEAEAKKQKDVHRAHLKGQPEMKFANGYELGWTGGKVTTTEQVDVDALVELVESAGLAVPIRYVDKQSATSISVKGPKK